MRWVIRIVGLMVVGFFLFTFLGPQYFGDPDLRVHKAHQRHDLCLKASERKEVLMPVSPAIDNVIEGKSKDVAGVLGNERKNYVAQVNKRYNTCLADFDSLPKKCFDDFGAEYQAKGFDPEKYADFRKEIVAKCVAKGEIEAECNNLYSANDIQMCIEHKMKDAGYSS